MATSIEDLIDKCGGFGRYQLLVMVGILLHKICCGWSMLQMIFAGFIPDWHCEVGPFPGNASIHTNQSLKTCSLNNSYTGYEVEDCDRHWFGGSVKTVVTQWDLVCDRKWIKASITSIQMAGVLVGAITAGQLADLIGRKKTMFGFSLMHTLLNFGVGLSSFWEMFAAFRFFIGVGIGDLRVVTFTYLMGFMPTRWRLILCSISTLFLHPLSTQRQMGGLLVVTFTYPMEFMPTSWRPILCSIPIWATSISLFSVASLVTNNWVYVHIACGAIAVPAMLGIFHVPESIRWLTLKGRHVEAETIFEKMASVNGKTPPIETRFVLEKIYQEEMETRSKRTEYSFQDLFKGREQIKITIVCNFMWMTQTAIYYGLSFGVSSFAGNLYLNIFLSALMEALPMPITFYFNNKIGRKWTTIGLYILGGIPACGCLFVQFIVSAESLALWITGLCLTAKMFQGTGWVNSQIWINELHPTVIRNISFGFVNTTARIGGIIAPFAINFDNAPQVAYTIICAFTVSNILLCLLAPDTKGQQLSDSLKGPTTLLSSSSTPARDEQGKGDNWENTKFISNENGGH